MRKKTWSRGHNCVVHWVHCTWYSALQWCFSFSGWVWMEPLPLHFVIIINRRIINCFIFLLSGWLGMARPQFLMRRQDGYQRPQTFYRSFVSLLLIIIRMMMIRMMMIATMIIIVILRRLTVATGCCASLGSTGWSTACQGWSTTTKIRSTTTMNWSATTKPWSTSSN